MSVPLAITPDARWPASVSELVAAAGAAGFAAVGIGADRVGAVAAQAYRDAGIRCHEVLALVLVDDEGATMSAAERLAAAASCMAAEWVLTVFRAALTPGTTKLARQCAALFGEAGCGLAAEFSPFGPVSTIAEGLEVVRGANVGGGRAGLMIDSWHFSFGASTWDDLARVPLDEIAYVQFTDALAPQSEDLMHETMNRRALPGQGVLELDRFASTLLERGWQGLVSVEVLATEMQALPPSEMVRRIADTTVPYWR